MLETPYWEHSYMMTALIKYKKIQELCYHYKVAKTKTKKLVRLDKINHLNPLLPEGGRSNTHGSIAQTKKNILYSFFTIEAPCHYPYFYEVSFVQHKKFVR